MRGKLKLKKSAHANKLREGMVVSSGFKKTVPVPKERIIAAVLVVLLVTGGSWLVYHNINKGPRTTGNADSCTDTSGSGVLQQAYDALKPGDYERLKPVVEKIKAIPGHDSNADCLNVIVTYYINVTDYKNAQHYLDKLNQVYDPNRGFSKALGPDVKSIEELRAEVAFLGKQAELFRQNTMLLQNSEPGR